MLYAERGQALMSAHRRHLDGLAKITPPQAGMHAVAWLTKASDDVAAYDAVARLGVETRPLSLYRQAAGPPALVLGFGSVTTEAIERGAQNLARGLSAPPAA
jgi:GntR family transcriptional regulator/MocR family aminotransferase